MYAVDLDTANTANTAAPVHYRPILFGPDLLPALLADRKTQTRRPIKLPPGTLPIAIEPMGCSDGSNLRHGRGRPLWRAVYTDRDAPTLFAAPFAVDDVLWVRETFAIISPEQVGDDCWREVLQRPHRLHPDSNHHDGVAAAIYRIDGDIDLVHGTDGQTYRSWFPAIGMSFWASRIHLRVTNVRAQRVQDITRDECRAEGVFVPEDVPDHPHYLGFRLTWNRFYGRDRGLPFETNPWAWVIEFTRIPAVASR